MGIRHDQQSAYIQERRKWEMRPVMVDSQWVNEQIIDGKKRPGYMDGTYIQPLPIADGGRENWPHQEYPKMLYKAHRADGGPQIDIEGRSGILLVDSEQEENAMRRQGWHNTQGAALDAIGAQDREFAKLAAERNFETRRMSEQAQAEVAAVDEANSNHVPVIPETPIKKRGRPVKVAAVAKE